MEGLAEAVSAAEGALAAAERGREACIAASRAVIRMSKRAVHSAQAGEDCSARISEMRSAIEGALAGLGPSPDPACPAPLSDAMAEYAEAAVLWAAVSGGRVPSHSDLGVPAGAWVLGMADSVGELRRVALDRLIAGDCAGARSAFGCMEEMCSALLMLDVPDAVAPVRRKQDIARGVVERTRADIANAVVMDARRDARTQKLKAGGGPPAVSGQRLALGLPKFLTGLR